MTLTEMIAIVAENTATTQKEIKNVVHEFLHVIIDTLKNDVEDVRISGFGTFTNAVVQPLSPWL